MLIKTSGLVVGELDQGRTGVQRCFGKLEQWRAIAMRSDMTARAHSAAIPSATSMKSVPVDWGLPRVSHSAAAGGLRTGVATAPEFGEPFA